jgi:GcrA cell cycle regulator
MSNGKNSPWSDQAVADLTRLWAEGLSCKEVGEQLGFTRNAIVGKIQRLKLPTPEGKRVIERKAREPKAKKSTVTHQYTLSRLQRGGNNRIDSGSKLLIVETLEFKLRCVEIVPLNLTLADLPANGCHYIAGDDLLYCGHPVKEGSSYCTPHHHLVWVPPRPSLPKGRIYQGTDFARGAA